MDNEQLVNSINNVESNIKSYNEMKQHCKNCYKKRCSSSCQYFIPDIIHLDVMEKRKKELWDEYNTRHKGEGRYDGTVI